MAQHRHVGILLRPERTYCRQVLRGISQVCAEASWQCLFFPAEAIAALPAVHSMFDGVIGYFSETALGPELIRTRIPAVDISAAHWPTTLPRVSTDNYAVGRLAAAHLLSLGLGQFGYLDNSADRHLRREQGFKDVIESAGFSCHVFTEESPSEGSPVSREQDRVERWIRALPKPVGVLASTDSRAFHLLAACRTANVDVPDSIAVLGVGNDDIPCQMASPPLTSIALATQQIGAEAAKLLERLMGGDAPSEREVLVPPAGVVPRRSTDVAGAVDADVAAAVRYISMNVQHDLQVEDILREVPISRRALEQRFRKALGTSPAAEIRRAQVETAKRILAETDEPMSRVALAAGFNDAQQLSITFRRATGITPSAYRRRNRVAV